MTKLTSFSKWVINSFGGNSPKEAILNITNKLLLEANQKELPIKLSSIARIIGLNPYPIYRNQSSWGELININNKFRISLKMKSGKPPSIYWYGYPRLRFSYAHELIHCLFYDLSSSPPKRIAPIANNNEEEELCNYGASLLLLPDYIVNKFINSLNSNDFIYEVQCLSKKAKISLHASFIHLINNNYIKQTKNKLYILSSTHKGYRERGINKPRCIISVIYDNYEVKKTFIPTYKGLEAINDSWSLIKYFYNDLNTPYLYVKNEVINYNFKKYLINGIHKKIRKNYVWSDLEIKEI